MEALVEAITSICDTHSAYLYTFPQFSIKYSGWSRWGYSFDWENDEWKVLCKWNVGLIYLPSAKWRTGRYFLLLARGAPPPPPFESGRWRIGFSSTFSKNGEYLSLLTNFGVWRSHRLLLLQTIHMKEIIEVRFCVGELENDIILYNDERTQLPRIISLSRLDRVPVGSVIPYMTIIWVQINKLLQLQTAVELIYCEFSFTNTALHPLSQLISICKILYHHFHS